MSNKNNGNHKHLTLSQRLVIERGLNDQISFVEMSRKIQKDPSTISKEVRKQLLRKINKFPH